MRNTIATALIAGFAIATAAGSAPAQQPQPTAALAAPPRTIADIVAILDQEKPDPARRARLIAEAEAPEPAGLDARQRGRFLYQRAQAASQIGRTEAALRDAESAVKLAEEVGDETVRIKALLTGLYRVTGRHQDALKLSLEAAAAEEKGRAKGRLFGIYRSIVQTAIDLGRFELAQNYVGYSQQVYEQLVANTRNHNNYMHETSWLSSIETAKGMIAQARGRPAEAEMHAFKSVEYLRDAVEKSKHWVDKPPAGAMETGLDYYIAGLGLAKLEQGRMSEAEVDVRQALLSTLRRQGKYSQPTAKIAIDLARVILGQGRYDEAEKLARTAIEILHELGFDDDTPQSLQARRIVADVETMQRRWTDASRDYETLVAATQSWSAGRARMLRSSPGRILALARVGQGEKAAEIAATAARARIQQVGEKHYDAAEARGILGIALAAARRDAEALAAFREAIPILISASRQAETEEIALATRDFFTQTIIEDYIALLARIQGTPAAANLDAGTESFRLADAARGRSVQRALAASAARASVRDPALAALVRQEQDQQKQIGAQFGLLGQLLALPPEQRDDKAIQQLRTEVDKLRTDRAAIRQQIERQFPEYANLIDPRPPAVEDIRAVLRPGEALVSFYLAQENSFVWAVPKDGPVAFAAAPVGAKAIEDQILKLRRALEPDAETLGDIPPFDLAVAHDLYKTLLMPVAAGWQPAKSLFVVTNGALGLLPLALLPTAPAQVDANAAPLFSGYKSVPWLVRSHAVTQLPSTAALKTLRALPAGAASRQPLIGFGDPFFSPAQAAEAGPADIRIAAVDAVAVRGAKLKRRNLPRTTDVDSADLGLLPRLPDTADELRSVAGAVKSDPAKALFLGRDANETAVKKAQLTGYKVVAFATHGLVPGDLDGLTQPALALSAPAVAGVDGDGLLTMDEILGLRLDADWVVLSACNTGAGAGAGAEAASGLGRAFFYAGTRALLLTNWSVHSASAKDLVTDLFRRQAEDSALGRAEALRRAMIALLDGPGYQEGGRSMFSYAHPLFWAPYSLMGDGG